jgi:hypothetical protein
MKKIKFLVPVAVLLIGFTSCKKGFLEEEPYSFISAGALYKNDAGCEAAINGCYATMAEFAGFGAGYHSLINIGSGGFWTTQGPAQDLNTLTFGASTLFLTNNSPWDQFYSAIKVANDIIVNVPNGNATDSVKTKIIGEAYLLRGMLYFNLVRMFGGVPLRTRPVTEDEVNIARATREETYNLIINDLEKAKTMMTAYAQKGRPTKYAAYALLGKVYIAMAGNDPASPNWAKAKTELLKVVTESGYALEKSSTLLFSPTNENSKESIIEIQYAISGGPNGQFTNYYSPSQSTFTPLAANGPFGRNRINKDIFDRHKAQYPTDPRIDANYIYGSYPKIGGGNQTVYPANTAGQGFPYLKHYIDPNYVATFSNRNFIYLRYADVLLSLAECENEIAGPANAYQYVNQVLTRARDKNGDGTVIATTPANWTGMTQVQFRDRIMRERRYELIGECHLWYDTRRRGQADFFAFLTEHNTHPTLNLAFDKIYPLNARLLLFPIPDKEINANTLINPSDQNPGY